MTKADRILSQTYEEIGLLDLSDEEKYRQIDNIVRRLAEINDESTISAGTTGTISERLCELAIRATSEGYYETLPREWKWLGDFSIIGKPFNLIISVKSFKAKERLLVSGSGSILTPTVGWGLFNDPSEWSEERTKSYLHRAFVAVYMPESTLNLVSDEARRIKNINNKPLLRKIYDFMADIEAAKIDQYIDIRKF